ncbi:hypothetical protein D3C76_1035250 [compost metagenome]
MPVAGVGGLDEQHGLERRLLVGRLLELGEALFQQPLVVQRDPEQGAGRDVMQGTAHACLLAMQRGEGSAVIVNVLTVIINMLTIVKRDRMSGHWLPCRIRCRMGAAGAWTRIRKRVLRDD